MENKIVQKKKELKGAKKKLLISSLFAVVLSISLFAVTSFASPSITVDLGNGDLGAGRYGLLEVMLTVLLLALAPSILIMMTSFTRIIIVMSFLRNALGTQQSPPNQVLVGLSLFLTLFIMFPVFSQINEEAYVPYKEEQISYEEAVEKAIVPMKQFMVKQIYTNDLNLFLTISEKQTGNKPVLNSRDDIMKLGMEIIIPSFVTSELKRAFTMGFLLFIPFLIIDMVVSSTLMSMGMVMLPPSMISLPFKLMIFVFVDGWNLLIGTLVSSFIK